MGFSVFWHQIKKSQHSHSFIGSNTVRKYPENINKSERRDPIAPLALIALTLDQLEVNLLPSLSSFLP